MSHYDHFTQNDVSLRLTGSVGLVVERPPRDREVVGSIPSRDKPKSKKFGCAYMVYFPMLDAQHYRVVPWKNVLRKECCKKCWMNCWMKSANDVLEEVLDEEGLNDDALTPRT